SSDLGRWKEEEANTGGQSKWDRGKENEKEKDTVSEPRLLYRENDGRWAFCILPEEVEAVLTWVHDVCGHWSTQTTMKKCLGRFYWPTRSKDIAAFCKSCRNCQMIGSLRRRDRIPHPIIQVQPMDMIGM